MYARQGGATARENKTSGSVLFTGDGFIASGHWSDRYDCDVPNLGAAGPTTDEVIASLDQLADRQSDVVEVGTNDQGWDRSNEYIVRDMETVLCSPRKHLPGVCILIVSGPPREPDFAATVRLANRQPPAAPVRADPARPVPGTRALTGSTSCED